MDYFTFRNRNPSFAELQGVFVTGDEAYLRRSVCEALGDEEVERYRVDASDTDPGRIDELLRGTSFEQKRRLVCIVDRGGTFTRANEDWIRNRFSTDRPKTVPCLLAPGIRSNLKIVKWLRDELLHVECDTPDEDRVQQWIQSFFRSENMRADPQALEELMARAGPELTALRNEMEKLALFARDRDILRPDDVKRVVPDRKELDFFDFTDAWLAGDHEPVLKDIRRQLDRGESEVKITGGLLWAFRRLRSIIELSKMDYQPREISEELNIRKWIVDQTVRRFRHLDGDDLRDVARAFLHKDVVSRTGSLDASTALELMVLGGFRTGCGSSNTD